MQCSNHAQAVAVDTCGRCGAFVCGDCLELLGDEPYCRSCYARKDVTGGGSARAIVALLFSSAGLFCGAPMGIIGLFLAWREGLALERGEAPRGSRPFVKVAKVLGWTSVVLTVLAVGGFVLVNLLIAWRGHAPPPA